MPRVLIVDDSPTELLRLRQHLESPDKFPGFTNRRTPRQMRLFTTPTRTSMSTDLNKGHTILEVITPDRPGLLARVAQIFNQYDLRLQNAKIATLGERVEDVFFITHRDGQPLSNPELCKQLEQTLIDELDQIQQG